MVQAYESLDMWQKAQKLCLQFYKMAHVLPAWERRELARKIRNSSERVPQKIAEGTQAASINEYVNHLRESMLIVEKLKTYSEVACMLEYIPTDKLRALLKDLRSLEDTIWDMLRLLEAQQHAFNPSFAYVSTPLPMH